MSDLDRLKATFDAMGVEYETYYSSVVIKHRNEPHGRACIFEFDGDGKYVGHGVWM